MKDAVDASGLSSTFQGSTRPYRIRFRAGCSQLSCEFTKPTPLIDNR